MQNSGIPYTYILLLYLRDTFKNRTNKLSIVNANIKGMRTNLDDFKVLHISYYRSHLNMVKTTQCGKFLS